MTQEQIVGALIAAFDRACPNNATRTEVNAFFNGVVKGLSYNKNTNELDDELADQAWRLTWPVIEYLEARKERAVAQGRDVLNTDVLVYGDEPAFVYGPSRPHSWARGDEELTEESKQLLQIAQP
jgi:hypothetical protein